MNLKCTEMLAFEFFLVQLFIWLNTIYFYTLKTCQKKKRSEHFCQETFIRDKEPCAVHGQLIQDLLLPLTLSIWPISFWMTSCSHPLPTPNVTPACIFRPWFRTSVFQLVPFSEEWPAGRFFHSSQIPFGCSAWHASSLPVAGHCPKHPFHPNHQVAYLLW